MGRRMPFEVHDQVLFMAAQNDALERLEPGWSCRTRADIALSAMRARERRDRRAGALLAAVFVLALIPPIVSWLQARELLTAQGSAVQALTTGSR